MERLLAICHKICPQTLSINFAAIAISMSELEAGLKIISYLVAIIWTVLKISKEIKTWSSGKKN